MEIKFKLQAAALNAALEIVSIVPPRPITPTGGAGYLFVVRGDRCSIYSRDSLHVARAEFPLTDVEGEGAFIYPSQHVESFKFAEGEVGFHITSEGEEHKVKYDLGVGAGGERATFDPRLLATCDKDLEAATDERTFPVAILREAMAMSRPFLGPATDQRIEENYKTFQIFDAPSKEALAKADGYMFASNSVQAFYFYCDAFKGKGLAVHGQHLSLLAAFLAKADGLVTVKTGPNMTFAIDSKGRVLGWAHHQKQYEKFSYYALKMDKTVLAVPKARALAQLRYTKTELDAKRDKIKITFDMKGSNIRFAVTESNGKATSLPVDVKVLASEEKDFTAFVNIDHLINLFEGSKAEEVELRVAIIPPGDNNPKEKVMFRTVDEFWLDGEGKVVGGSGVEEGKEPEGAFRCKVTRFMPDKN